MKSGYFVGLFCVVAVFPINGITAPQNAVKLYVLQDSEKNQWCGYHEEKRWRAAIDDLGAIETASVDFIDGVPKVVKITEADNPESGDWIVYDQYNLGEHGAVLSLERTTNVLPGDVSRKELFELSQGHLERKSVTLRSLKSGKPLASTKAWFPKLSTATDVADLPFGPLIERLQEVMTHDSVCAPPSAPQGSSKRQP